MKLQFDSQQAYQLAAVKSVEGLFEGQPLAQNGVVGGGGAGNPAVGHSAKAIGNQLRLTEAQLLENLRKVQAANQLPPSESLAFLQYHDREGNRQNPQFPNYTVEMETGTGKTYTYLRTIYQLHQTYGFLKFIIVVPSVAIREGVLKNLQITASHFQNLYQHPALHHAVYESKKISLLRQFALSNAPQVLIINIDNFTKDSNIIHQLRETGHRPIEYLQASHPVVIVDEPQNMETDIRKEALASLNPLCTLRYSATHRNFYNLVYRLDPVKAHELGLVKQIEVAGIAEENASRAAVRLLAVGKGKQQLKAKIQLAAGESGGKSLAVWAKVGDDLFDLSQKNRQFGHGFILNQIDAAKQEITFSNGQTYGVDGATNQDDGQAIRWQLRQTLQIHFEKEAWLAPLGIKVLSLFFVDKVANYRLYGKDGAPNHGQFALWFEELYEEMQRQYPQLAQHPPENVHGGYFSQDKKGRFKDTTGKTKADDDAYQLIMRDKERLLDPAEPLRFVFSHTALREGWDSPNVFQVCTLGRSHSELKKRQEIGRGLRLPVDKAGNRVRDRELNVLTVIANQTYQAFAAQLQKEIRQESQADFSKQVKDARQKIRYRPYGNLSAEKHPVFFKLWQQFGAEVRYEVHFDTANLVDLGAKDLRGMRPIPPPGLISEKFRLSFGADGVGGKRVQQETQQAENFDTWLPDLYQHLQQHSGLTKQTLFQILEKSGRLGDFLVNPPIFLRDVTASLQKTLRGLQLENLVYSVAGKAAMDLPMLQNWERQAYLDEVYAVTAPKKSVADYVALRGSSERQMLENWEKAESVQFFCPYPETWAVPTPVGNFQPDWLVVLDDGQSGQVLAVSGSKGSGEPPTSLLGFQWACAHRFFAQLFPAIRLVEVGEFGQLVGG